MGTDSKRLAEEIRSLPPGEFRSMISTLSGGRVDPDDPRERSTRALYGGSVRTPAAAQSPGDQFRESGQHAAWLAKFPNGVPSMATNAMTDPVEIAGGLRALITASDSVAGDLVSPDRRPGVLEGALLRPLKVRDLITVQPTNSDEVQYTVELTRTAAAAPVTEATQLAHSGDTTATKPEGALTFDLLTASVKQFAVWVPATRRILADAGGLASYIDAYLTNDLALEVEDQIVAGSGGNGFTGLMNVSGTQTLGPPGGGLTEMDLLRRGLTKVRVVGRTEPTAILIHPDDAERIEIAKATDNTYLVGDPTGRQGIPSLWSVPIVESDALAAGVALVGDFRRAILFDREQTSIAVGTANEDFIRNIVRVLAESRAAFAVTRPSAFVKVDLVA